jgi:hypothetical protein
LQEVASLFFLIPAALAFIYLRAADLSFRFVVI